MPANVVNHRQSYKISLGMNEPAAALPLDNPNDHDDNDDDREDMLDTRIILIKNALGDK